MHLSKSEVSPLFAYPIQNGAASPQSSFAELARLHSNDSAPTPTPEAIADLIDLVADHRADLLKTFLDIVGEAEGIRQQAEELTDLVAACGVAEEASPCATAMAIAGDLEKLIQASDPWTHPAQIIKWPKAQALSQLCGRRLEDAVGADRERLQEILPRLERAARLTEKAALRRVQDTARPRN